jgi:hypothetical protein
MRKIEFITKLEGLLCAILVVVCVPLKVNAQISFTSEEYGLIFEIEDEYGSEASVTGYTHVNDELNIPLEVYYNDMIYSVTKIKSTAFIGCVDLRTVVIPERIGEIQDHAFRSCGNLENIIMLSEFPPEADESIFDDEVYRNATLYIPETGNSMEYYTNRLPWSRFQNIVCGEGGSVGYVGEYIDSDLSMRFKLYSDGTCSITYYYGDATDELVIPATVSTSEKDDVSYTSYIVTSIEAGAFTWSKMKTVIIPEGVKSIKEPAFLYCENLETVVIGSSVTDIDINAFANDKNINTIISLAKEAPTLADAFDESVYNNATLVIANGEDVLSSYREAENWGRFSNITQSIDESGYRVAAVKDDGSDLWFSTNIDGTCELIAGVLSSYSEIEDVNIPSYIKYEGNDYKVTAIGDYAFAFRDNVKTLTIPETVTTIGDNAFNNCSITTVQIPDGVTTIERFAFYGSDIKELNISTSVSTLESYSFGACYSLTNLTIPEGVTNIAEKAFWYCLNLKDLVIIMNPNGETIGNKAFSECALQTVMFKDIYSPIKLAKVASRSTEDGTVTLGDNLFYGNTNLETVYLYTYTLPIASSSTFTSDQYAQTKLVCYENMETSVSSADVWKEFGTPTLTGVESIASEDFAVKTEGSEILINGYDGVVSVYNTYGSKVYSGRGNRIAVSAPGIYVVIANGKHMKIVVKGD